MSIDERKAGAPGAGWKNTKTFEVAIKGPYGKANGVIEEELQEICVRLEDNKALGLGELLSRALKLTVKTKLKLFASMVKLGVYLSLLISIRWTRGGKNTL